MIRGITGGRYLNVQGGNSGSTYVNNHSGSQGVGNMRYNTSNQTMEVYDGNNWIQLPNNYASINLDDEAVNLLDWAREKKRQEDGYQRLAQDSEAVKIALDKLRKAEAELELITILSRDHEQTTTS
jgi:hypothetical protein